MSELDQVLHKPTPPNDERWHIVLQGHPDELLVALAALMEYLQNVIITAEWTGLDALTICLDWIDVVMPRFVTDHIEQINSDKEIIIKIIHNGREQCHGHNLYVPTA